MIKTKALILILAIAASSFLTAQDYEVNWGPTYKKDGGMFSVMYLAGTTQKNYFVISKPKRDNTLTVFDYNHRLVKVHNLELTHEKNNLSPSTYFETTSGNYGIMNYYNKKENKMYEFVSKIADDGSLSKVKEISSYDYKVKIGAAYRMAYGFGGSTNQDAEGYYLSKNKKFVLNAGTQSYFESKKDADEKIYLKVYDDKFDLLWEREASFNGRKDEDLDIQQFFIDDNGIAYASGIQWKEKEDREKGIPNYDYIIFKLEDGNTEEYTVEIGKDVVPQDVGIFHGEDNNIYVGGLYTNREARKYNANGVFFSIIDPKSTTQKLTRHYEFSPEILEGLISDKKIAKGKGLRNFDVQHLVFSENGDFSFIAEENYITVHTRTVDGRTTTYYRYHTNELIIPRFNKEGDLVNIKQIDKDFTSLTPVNTSYTIARFEDKVYLVYNDFKNKEERKSDDVKGKKRSRYTDLLVIDGTGEIEIEKTLFSSEEIETEFYPSISTQVGRSGKLLLYGFKKKEYQFGTIELK